MSRVFVGEEVALGRKVVVKVLAPVLAAGVSAERFQREIELAAQLQHPNIVPVLTTGVAVGLPYYTMPFVDGLSLRQRLDRNAAISIGQASAILKDVAARTDAPGGTLTQAGASLGTRLHGSRANFGRSRCRSSCRYLFVRLCRLRAG